MSFCEAVIKSYLEGKYKNASKFTRKDHHQVSSCRDMTKNGILQASQPE